MADLSWLMPQEDLSDQKFADRLDLSDTNPWNITGVCKQMDPFAEIYNEEDGHTYWMTSMGDWKYAPTNSDGTVDWNCAMYVEDIRADSAMAFVEKIEENMTSFDHLQIQDSRRRPFAP